MASALRLPAMLVVIMFAVYATQVSSNPAELGLLGLGDLTTEDQAGPYNIPLVQAFEVEGKAL